MLLNITTVSVMNLRFVGLLASDNGSILGLGLCVRGTYSAQRMVRFRSDLADSLAGVTQQVSLGLVAFVNKSCVCPETE